MSKENALELLIKAAEAAIAYDRAIQRCADDPDKMSSYCTAQGDDLDTLYFNWLQAARAGLIAAKSVPAIANKATEEGKQPSDETILRLSEETALNFVTDERRPDNATIIDFARTVIAADRASRQVANKAEVEPSDSYKAGYADGMEEGAKLAFWGDKPSEKFPEGWPAEIWLNAGDDELGPFCEYDEVSWCSAPQGESDIRYIREDLLATPPATTGASTVLTDERISAGARSLSNRQADACGVDREDNWKLYGGSIIEEFREACTAAFGTQVAAQAGQVAVPEGFVLVPVEPTPEMIAAIHFKGDLDIAIGHGQFYKDAEEDYAAMLAAAPSPAKESK